MRLPVDLRSDTVTRPTPAMMAAILGAEVGDDVFGDDPTIVKLEARGAELVGMEAGLFMASGTMGNQVAIMTHTSLGNEVIVGRPCHIQEHEAGAAAVLSGVTLVPLDAPTGALDPAVVAAAVRTPDVHHPVTRLLCLECAHSSGAVQPLDSLRSVMAVAREREVRVHLDGARIFNAAHALGRSAAEVARGADSVMYCLSKGLGAPVGSLLCGSRDFIARARNNRKIVGGGMRQVGLLGAAGLHALEHHVERLVEDHERAARLARILAGVAGIEICEDRRAINMVWFRHEHHGDPLELVRAMAERQVKIYPPLGGEWRLVTHLDIDDEELAYAGERLVEVFGLGEGRE
ncbi:MAG: low-specificity L-threonine aldolase [bacterium]